MDNLILVSRRYPLRVPEIEEKNLCTVGRKHGDIKLDREAADQLKLLLQYIGGTEEIVPVSGFRSFEEQKQIFEDSMEENGERYTLRYVAYPGCSEHHTGLAIDLAESADEIDFIAPEFPYKGICQKFRENAHKFGFIERYPKGKEHITGIAHEPWHFRYVGAPHAGIIYEKGLALEEYLLA